LRLDGINELLVVLVVDALDALRVGCAENDTSSGDDGCDTRFGEVTVDVWRLDGDTALLLLLEDEDNVLEIVFPTIGLPS